MDIDKKIAEIKGRLIKARYSSSILEQKVIDDCEWLINQLKACREEKEKNKREIERLEGRLRHWKVW